MTVQLFNQKQRLVALIAASSPVFHYAAASLGSISYIEQLHGLMMADTGSFLHHVAHLRTKVESAAAAVERANHGCFSGLPLGRRSVAAGAAPAAGAEQRRRCLVLVPQIPASGGHAHTQAAAINRF
jgi:hypothetical protein